MLFGSAARGDGDTDSDVDILLVHAGEESAWEDEQYALARQIRAWTGNQAQFVVVDESRWEQMTAENDPLVGSIDRDGVDLMVKAFIG